MGPSPPGWSGKGSRTSAAKASKAHTHQTASGRADKWQHMPRRIGPSKAATIIGRPVETCAMMFSRSGSTAVNRTISHEMVEADQSSRHIALDRRVGEHPTSMPMTEPFSNPLSYRCWSATAAFRAFAESFPTSSFRFASRESRCSCKSSGKGFSGSGRYMM